MGAASRTTRPYVRDDLSGAKLLELMVQHNQAVVDMVALGTEAELRLTGVGYVALLTAQQIGITGVTGALDAHPADPDLLYNEMPHAPGDLTERALRSLVRQINRRIEDGLAMSLQLNTDDLDGLDVAAVGQPTAGVVGILQALGEEGSINWWSWPDQDQPGGYGASGRLLQHLTTMHNRLVQHMHDLAAVLDGTQNVGFLPVLAGGNTGNGTFTLLWIEGDPPTGVIDATASAAHDRTIFGVLDATGLASALSGTVEGVEGLVGGAAETVTLTYLGHDTWSVSGSATGAGANATTGVPYGYDGVALYSFLITRGHEPYTVGDVFTFTLIEGSMGFTVEWTPNAGAPVDVGVAYSEVEFHYAGDADEGIPGFGLSIVAGLTGWAVADTGAIDVSELTIALADFESQIGALWINEVNHPVLEHDYTHPA